jgi:hypothetical protein
LLLTQLCSTQRSSRSRSSALGERHIIPSISSSLTKSSSHGLILGEPSRRSVPTMHISRLRKRASPSAASSGEAATNAAQFIRRAPPIR